ncbi:hypothetical protein I317_01531 [Kwoniella heveanensis CBS 569]|nr:hypothetical protein I317_01531 [Kwoniella heveanensis CBS 569]
MERSSSQRDLRSERLSRTPYTRPEPSRLRKSTSMTPLATLKSIVSYVSSPFTRSSSLLPTHSTNQNQNQSQDLDVRVNREDSIEIDQDQKSESGSEDNWNGEPPANMQGQDVFSLAAAAGRRGDDFEERASSWRARGEKPGGRRELARLGLEILTTIPPNQTSTTFKPNHDLPTPTAPGHLASLNLSPSMPTLSSSSNIVSSSSLKVPSAGAPRASGSKSTLTRARSPLAPAEGDNHSLPSRSPLPSFVPPSVSTPQNSASATGLSSSASSAALTAFLEAKKGQQMTPEDFRVIETLTENMKAESHIGSPPRSAADRTNGWAAGSYLSSGSGLKSSRSFIANANPYRQRYLGPGMSPRRITGDEGGEEEIMDVDETSSSPAKLPHPANGLSSSISMPSLNGSAKSLPLDRSQNKFFAGPIHTPSRPSPLSRSINNTPDSPASASATSSHPVDEKAKRKAEAEAAGKKRAAEIIMDIIDEEIGPVVPTRQAEPVVFNPYDRRSLDPSPAPAVPSSTPNKAFAGSTPRKAGQQSSVSPARRTPTRGAAAKLEAHREAMKGSKPLTTIDRIKGVRPWENRGSPSRSTKSTSPDRVDTSTPDDDIIEIDELVNDSEAASSSSRAPSPAPASEAQSSANKPAGPTFTSASAKIPPAETFNPFSPPTLSFSAQSLPKTSSQTVPSIGSFDSPTRDSIIAASKSQENSVPRPTFNFTPLPAPAQEPESREPKAAAAPASTSSFSSKLDANAIYLSAKDSALKIAKPALPFFTFTLPPRPLESSKTKEQAEAAEAVRREASRRPVPTFTFTLTTSDTVNSTDSVNAKASGAEWTCSLCMLKNPASATEKCTVCENPKPAAAPAPAKVPPFTFGASASPSSSSGASASSGSPWTCSLCMLQNPASATEKCTICEAPKPKAASSTSTVPSAASTPFNGFGAGFGPKKAEGGQWTCSTCMLQNPDSAKEKCTICDAKRP